MKSTSVNIEFVDNKFSCANDVLAYYNGKKASKALLDEINRDLSDADDIKKTLCNGLDEKAFEFAAITGALKKIKSLTETMVKELNLQ